jgi:hypothetical protein
LAIANKESTTKTLATLTAAALGLATLPGCILVATDRHYYPATKKDLDSVRQVEPGGAAPSVRSDYKDQLAKLTPGISVDAFKAQFPSAVFVEQKEDAGHKIDAYSVKLEERYHVRGEGVIQTSHDEAWFYFRDGGFVKWGEPRQWP